MSDKGRSTASIWFQSNLKMNHGHKTSTRRKVVMENTPKGLLRYLFPIAATKLAWRGNEAVVL